MLDSLYVGVTGLQGFSKGLRVISNNVTNLNTPGFKGEHQQFGDLFYQNQPQGGGGFSQLGTGLQTLGTAINYLAGEVRQTGNTLDASIAGDGFFMLDSGAGPVYTRAGQFQFGPDGVLVSSTNGHKVMGYDATGTLGEISLSGLRINPAKATTSVQLNGNLASTITDFTLASVKVIDASGAEHVLKMVFKRPNAATTTWNVDVQEGTTSVGTGSLSFADGHPVAGKDSFSFNYAPAGASAMTVGVKLGAEATSFASSTASTLAVEKQDGFAAGALAGATFDDKGVLKLSYANGQKVDGAQLALARFDVPGSLQQAGGSEFSTPDPLAARLGRAGEGGRGDVAAGQLELSNVDLSVEFSDLIVMQRGYQASSQIVSTANDMLKELFDMKGRG
ncbi:flagellar hook protein FlgE [Rhizobacter sp. P5_C2]|jgi:flagellar hook protein FlgE